eukprot:scaffold312211_cov19-Prasinocladus_malaysianus.AAC.1
MRKVSPCHALRMAKACPSDVCNQMTDANVIDVHFKTFCPRTYKILIHRCAKEFTDKDDIAYDYQCPEENRQFIHERQRDRGGGGLRYSVLIVRFQSAILAMVQG